jgi:hypothetical protein
MNEADAVVSRYLAVWNETDPSARRAAIDELWADDATYVDPMVVAEGREAIEATVAAVQGQFPGFTFTLLGDVDAHHNLARFRWALGPAGVEPPVVGFDVAVLTDDGRLHHVHGFLDQVPNA